jgi:hypothetical protein
MLAACRETILRYRYRSRAREQHRDNGETFQDGHLNPLSAYAYTHPVLINAHEEPPVPLDGSKFGDTQSFRLLDRWRFGILEPMQLAPAAFATLLASDVFSFADSGGPTLT